ncbi:MAG: bleomycin resistance protein [Ignavibacteria bacterium]|nr:bleomycin resistance protein [Ignavibacteria bacterium]
MELNFGRIIILVNDYDEAFDFYERTLSCKKFFDITENGQRFLHIGLNSNDKSGIWFHKAETNEQKARVGNQTSGLPLLRGFIQIPFANIMEHLLNENVKKLPREPVEKARQQFFFQDLYGNEIVLVEMKTEVSQTN